MLRVSLMALFTKVSIEVYALSFIIKFDLSTMRHSSAALLIFKILSSCFISIQ